MEDIEKKYAKDIGNEDKFKMSHQEKGSKNFALGEKTFKRGQVYRKQQNGSHDQNEKKIFGKHGKV